MTMTLTPLPVFRDEARQRLGARELRRNITAMLRTRVPHTEIDDVAQTVLCDALAAPHIPADPIELRRWLAGITRHKVADFHRQSKRTPAMVSDETLDLGTAPPPYEEREILKSVLEGTSSPRDRETMQWLVREHAGERLCEIAEETGVPAPVVRQRVSRLRRALRSRFMMLLLAVLVVGAGAVAVGTTKNDVATIAPDPSTIVQPAQSAEPRAPAAPTTPAPSLAGDYRVESLAPDTPIPPQMKSTVDAEMKTATVHITQGPTQGKVDIVSQSFSISRQITNVEKDKKTGVIRFKLVAPDGTVQDATATPDGEKLRVTLARAPSGAKSIGGTIVLRRNEPRAKP
jgi:DNA-directed RNA polymerase specialized sigma24 family protein